MRLEVGVNEKKEARYEGPADGELGSTLISLWGRGGVLEGMD